MPHTQNPASGADGGLKKSGESSDNEMPRPSHTAVSVSPSRTRVVSTEASYL